MNSDKNPFLTKRFLSMSVLYAIFFLVFSFIADTLGIYVLAYNEDNEKINAFDMVSIAPAIAVCYLLEGFIAVALKEEPREYRKRIYKVEAFCFIGLYFVAIVMYMFFKAIDFSTSLSNILATLPMWSYGIYLFYARCVFKK